MNRFTYGSRYDRQQHNRDHGQNRCAACGELCGSITRTWDEPEEYWGATAYRTEGETVSDCCDAECDESTTEELEAREAEEAEA